VRSLDDLERLMAQFPDDQAGNTALAQRLWRCNPWTRARQLRDLARYQWLVMRQGVDTVKPDVHVRRFAEAAVGRKLNDQTSSS